MPKTDPFSIRLTPEQNNRALDIQRACNGEVTRTDVISAALELLFAAMPVLPAIVASPSMSKLLGLYDPDRDPSVTRLKNRAIQDD